MSKLLLFCPIAAFFLPLKLLSHKCNLPACHAVCFQLHFVRLYGILSRTDTCTIAKATECTSIIVQRMVWNEVSSRVVAVELWFNLPISTISYQSSYLVVWRNNWKYHQYPSSFSWRVWSRSACFLPDKEVFHWRGMEKNWPHPRSFPYPYLRCKIQKINNWCTVTKFQFQQWDPY